MWKWYKNGQNITLHDTFPYAIDTYRWSFIDVRLECYRVGSNLKATMMRPNIYADIYELLVCVGKLFLTT